MSGGGGSGAPKFFMPAVPSATSLADSSETEADDEGGATLLGGSRAGMGAGLLSPLGGDGGGGGSVLLAGDSATSPKGKSPKAGRRARGGFAGGHTERGEEEPPAGGSTSQTPRGGDGEAQSGGGLGDGVGGADPLMARRPRPLSVTSSTASIEDEAGALPSLGPRTSRTSRSGREPSPKDALTDWANVIGRHSEEMSPLHPASLVSSPNAGDAVGFAEGATTPRAGHDAGDGELPPPRRSQGSNGVGAGSANQEAAEAQPTGWEGGQASDLPDAPDVSLSDQNGDGAYGGGYFEEDGTWVASDGTRWVQRDGEWVSADAYANPDGAGGGYTADPDGSGYVNQEGHYAEDGSWVPAAHHHSNHQHHQQHYEGGAYQEGYQEAYRQEEGSRRASMEGSAAGSQGARASAGYEYATQQPPEPAAEAAEGEEIPEDAEGYWHQDEAGTWFFTPMEGGEPVAWDPAAYEEEWQAALDAANAVAADAEAARAEAVAASTFAEAAARQHAEEAAALKARVADLEARLRAYDLGSNPGGDDGMPGGDGGDAAGDEAQAARAAGYRAGHADGVREGRAAAEAENEEDMADLLVCMGQEDRKIERLRELLEERGVDTAAVMEALEAEEDAQLMELVEREAAAARGEPTGVVDEGEDADNLGDGGLDHLPDGPHDETSFASSVPYMADASVALPGDVSVIDDVHVSTPRSGGGHVVDPVAVVHHGDISTDDVRGDILPMTGIVQMGVGAPPDTPTAGGARVLHDISLPDIPTFPGDFDAEDTADDVPRADVLAGSPADEAVHAATGGAPEAAATEGAPEVAPKGDEWNIPGEAPQLSAGGNEAGAESPGGWDVDLDLHLPDVPAPSLPQVAPPVAAGDTHPSEMLETGEPPMAFADMAQEPAPAAGPFGGPFGDATAGDDVSFFERFDERAQGGAAQDMEQRGEMAMQQVDLGGDSGGGWGGDDLDLNLQAYEQEQQARDAFDVGSAGEQQQQQWDPQQQQQQQQWDPQEQQQQWDPQQEQEQQQQWDPQQQHQWDPQQQHQWDPQQQHQWDPQQQEQWDPQQQQQQWDAQQQQQQQQWDAQQQQQQQQWDAQQQLHQWDAQQHQWDAQQQLDPTVQGFEPQEQQQDAYEHSTQPSAETQQGAAFGQYGAAPYEGMTYAAYGADGSQGQWAGQPAVQQQSMVYGQELPQQQPQQPVLFSPYGGGNLEDSAGQWPYGQDEKLR